MIIYEDYGKSAVGHDLTRVYSDQHFYIERDGQLLEEDIYLSILPRSYNETDIPIDENSTLEDEYAEAGKILLGVKE